MIRQNWNGEECNNKVRKRGGSSSSSSSLVQSYRLKRAVLVGKRGGGSNSTTPVPLWKMNSRSPSLQNDSGNSSKIFKNLQQQTAKGTVSDLSVSARKLGATLWEINGVVLPIPKKEENFLKSSSKFGALASQITPVSERMERSNLDSDRRRTSIGSHRILQTDFSLQNGCLIEVDQTQNRGSGVDRHRLKDVKNGLSASKELLKVLNRVWGVEEHQSVCLSLFSAMKAELDRSCIQVTKLIHEQRYNNYHGEVDVLLKQFEEEKASWKLKEQDKIYAAITSIAKELKVEKKLRKQTERLNKKLGKELADTKTSLSKATKELEGEKRAREILEQVCDELARDIGEDRAEVEELKRQSVKVREEVEKEREMLQLADVLREERVQMKLSEAKYQFEEKNAVVDKLRNELEAYLRSKNGQEHGGESPNYERIKELERHLRETLPSTCYYQDKEKENGEVLDDDDDDNDSADSDLHSLEENPFDQVVHKRRVAMAKAQGNTSAAIDWLNKYLDLFMADHEAWRELAEIYVSLQMYKQAAFCYEELILSQPTVPLYHLSYADVLYTLGGLENLQTAKKYYASTIDLTGGKSTRALFGICLCTSAIGQLTKGRNKEDKESPELQSLSAMALEKDYKQRAPSRLSVLSSALRSLKI